MLAIIYLIVSVYLGDIICRRFFNFVSLPHRLASALLVGLLLSSWFTYLGALIFSNASQPLLWGNLLFFIAAVGFILWHEKFSAKESLLKTAFPLAAQTDKWDWIIIGVYFLFVSWLMFGTMGVYDNKWWVAPRHWSDFGPNTAVMQNFIFGQNFPPENPHYAGELMRHHFLFWFQAANLEYLGLSPASSVNVLSVLTMVAMLTCIMVLGVVLFDSKAVGRIASALYFFAGSLSYIPFLRSQQTITQAVSSIFNLRTFLKSGFPYVGEEWGLWTVDVFLQQRHFASGIGIGLLVLIFLISHYRKRSIADERAADFVAEQTVSSNNFRQIVPGFIFCGVLIGLLPFWNSAVFISAFAVLGCWFLFFPGRHYLLSLAAATAAVCLPQLIFIRLGKAAVPGYPKFKWGYVVTDPTVARIAEFLAFSIGFKWVLIVIALLFASWFHKRVFLAASSLLIVAFFVQFNPDILANHKFINIWLIVANLFVAYGIWYLWQGKLIKQAVIAKTAVIVLTLGIVAGGIIDFFPIHNERGLAEVPYKDDRLITWLRAETKPSDIFLTQRYVGHQILLAGRRIFYGWGYYAWSAGLNTQTREAIYLRLFEERNPEKLVRLLNENRIAYVVIDNDLRSQTDIVKNLNEKVYVEYLPQVFPNQEKEFGNINIYRVPQYDEWRRGLTSEQLDKIRALDPSSINIPPDVNILKGAK